MTPSCLRRALLHGARCAAAMAACLGTGALAQTAAPAPPTVTVSASATATVSNDRLQAWLEAEAENASATVAANQVNAAMARALAIAKGYASVQVATAGYWTQQVSDKPKVPRWRVAQTVRLESSDFTAAAALISRLQDEDGLLLSGMGLSLTEKTRRGAEDSVTQEAIKLWQARAQQAARGLGYAAWKPGHVTVQTGDGGRVYPAPRLAAMANSAGAPVAVEGGTTDVTVTVSGEALLE